MRKTFNYLSDLFFSTGLRLQLGRVTLFIAIASFLIHLLLYVIYHYCLGLAPSGLLSSPINAIYTPFSFLLVYEAYLLLFYLQHSTTIYVGKQYEIITLILIRGIFKDMTHLDLDRGHFMSLNNQELWFDLSTVVALFVLIFLFYKIGGRTVKEIVPSETAQLVDFRMQRFVQSKKTLSTLLFFATIVIGIYSFGNWVYELQSGGQLVITPNINAIFFDHFFTLLILADVLILLFSLFYTDEFPIIIRNSSFVISTILLKLSFGAESGIAQLFIIAGVSFGVGVSFVTHSFFKN